MTSEDKITAENTNLNQRTSTVTSSTGGARISGISGISGGPKRVESSQKPSLLQSMFGGGLESSGNRSQIS